MTTGAKSWTTFRQASRCWGNANRCTKRCRGWSEDISGVKSYARLPKNVKSYLRRIEELTGSPIDIVSIGPDRDETIVLKNPYVRRPAAKKPPAKKR